MITKLKNTAQANPEKFKRIIFFIILIFLPLDILFFYSINFWGKIYPNVLVNSLNVGGKSRVEAQEILKNNFSQKLPTLALTAKSNAYTLNTSDIDARVSFKNTVNNAYTIGRNNTFLKNQQTRLKLLNNEFQIPLAITVNQGKLKTFIASLSAELNEPVIPSTVSIINFKGVRIATVSAGKTGKYLEEKKLKKQILDSYANQNFDSIIIPIKPKTDNISPIKLEKTRKTAHNLIDKKLILEYEKTTWELQDEELINFLSIHNSFDKDKIASWSAQLAETVNKVPENALFDFDGQRVTEFKPAKPGTTLNQQKTVESIKTGIEFLANNQDEKYQFRLEVSLTDPKITTDEVNDLGIKERIGIGESWFGHSIASRIHNLTLASNKMHGVLVPPGETFSLLETVGEIDAAHGFQSAYIIQNGRTVLGDGGGVCQTSTTMFRAALDAGLEIIERHPHAYRVSYYEQNYQVGVDASVFGPTIDIKFKNDTPAHILIQTTIDPVNVYLKYELYGTSDGRVAEIGESRIWDQAPPPPDLYEDDPTLLVGQIKQIDWKAWGAKTAFDWKVTRNGETLQEKTWYSSYRPWQAVFLKGTKEG
jgi:vancomycin resistance protein YoaR